MTDITFIAEIGNNHNGSLERAIRLIDAAKNIGCTVAKFQLRNFASLYRGQGDLVEDLGVEYTKDLLRKYELSREDHVKLQIYCKSIGIEYMCTPWDSVSIDFLEKIGVKRYKVASADFDNIPLLEKLVQTEKPLILSTGMATYEEIKSRVDFLNQKNADITILHCNSTYPAPLEDIELNFLNRIKSLCKNYGYSGHERGIAVSLGAIALGSTVIERHITEDRCLEGPDHAASLLPNEFKTLIQYGLEIKKALGSESIVQRKLSQGALLNKENLGKSIVARHSMSRGHILTSNDLSIKSPGQGLSPSQLQNLVGKKLTHDVSEDQFILEKHFERASTELKKLVFDFNWGIPVRPHDVKFLHDIFDAPVYEFHISYRDLQRQLPNEDWSFLKSKTILVHCPELFENSKLLNLCDTKEISTHINNLNRVCEYSRMLASKIETEQIIKIVTNIGGFSLDDFIPLSERDIQYEKIANNLQKIDENGCEILIQNMAPFPWHFGGQRYQNIFMDADEIISFCQINGRKITLDTAHLSMFCKYTGKDFIHAVHQLSPVVAHWHMSDSQGSNGEGVQMGTGDIDFCNVLEAVNNEQSFIVETWQGHKNDGMGFYRDLTYLIEGARRIA